MALGVDRLPVPHDGNHPIERPGHRQPEQGINLAVEGRLAQQRMGAEHRVKKQEKDQFAEELDRKCQGNPDYGAKLRKSGYPLFYCFRMIMPLDNTS